MSSKIKVEIIPEGISALFKSSEMKDYLSTVSDAAISTAEAMSGGKYGKNVHDASFTAISNVFPDDAVARSDNYKNNTCIKSVRSLGLPGDKPKY